MPFPNLHSKGAADAAPSFKIGLSRRHFNDPQNDRNQPWHRRHKRNRPSPPYTLFFGRIVFNPFNLLAERAQHLKKEPCFALYSGLDIIYAAFHFSQIHACLVHLLFELTEPFAMTLLQPSRFTSDGTQLRIPPVPMD
jgi:hypothetical protein